MLKRLREVSSKLSQNKLFLPGFPATSLFFLFFFPTKAYRNSQPLTPPKPAPFLPSFAWPKTHQKTHHLPLLPPSRLDFLLPCSSHQQGTAPSLAKPNRGSPLLTLILFQQPQHCPLIISFGLCFHFFLHITLAEQRRRKSRKPRRERVTKT